MKNILSVIAMMALLLFTNNQRLATSDCSADTIYFSDGAVQKGLVVEEYYDRFIFNTEDGERVVLRADIDEIFFDEPYQNSVYMGNRFEKVGDFDSALKFYRTALQAYPNYLPAREMSKGLEDAKWRFGKTWSYRELKGILQAQLGIALKKKNGSVTVEKVTAADSPFMPRDAVISCWEHPVTYAGLKNASRLLIGLSNSMLDAALERDIKIADMASINIFTKMAVGMGVEGPQVEYVRESKHPYKQGIRQGDIIVKIDGESTRYMKLPEVKKKIFNTKDKIITIKRRVTVMRKRAETNGVKNAMWVWNSGELLTEPAKTKEFLDFCKKKNIGTIFFQLHYRFLPSGEGAVCELLFIDELKAFLKQAHAQGIGVHALDGAPTLCLAQSHHLVLAQLKSVIDYNTSVSAEERFDGVHYDNEPYLLPAYESGMKGEILSQYLLLNQKCAEFIRTSGHKLEFGVDIPFWFNELDGLDGKMIDICDNVGIMDYRNFASGPDGIVAHAVDKLKYAAAAGKKVFVGVETSQYKGQEVHFVSCLTQGRFDELTAPGGTLNIFAVQNKFEGFWLRTLKHDGRIYVGLVTDAAQDQEAFRKALTALGGIFGSVKKPDDPKALDEMTFSAQHDLLANPELSDPQAADYTDDTGAACVIFTAKEGMLDKLTFAHLTEKDLDSVLSEAVQEFKKYRSFAGFAIHHYTSYKALCEKK